MLCFAFRRAAALAAISGRRCYVTDMPPDAMGAPAAVVQEYTIDKLWPLWNEGRLYSLSVPELSLFLTKQRITVDAKWKKAALVRQVEEVMQAADDAKNKKGGAAGAGGSSSSSAAATYGRWDKSAGEASSSGAGELLMDLNQSGFYEGGSAASSAPRAFQVFVQDYSADLVVSRVNTTSFPGFPANAECFTLLPANATTAAASRYNKALQWCILNARNLTMDAEIFFEFGKLLLKPEAARKNRQVCSVWTLQQRLQLTHPYHWVSCAASAATPAVEKFLSEHAFSAPGGALPSIAYDVNVQRKATTFRLGLDNNAKVLSVDRPFELLQQTHLIREAGPDVRMLMRAKAPIRKEDADAFTNTPIVDIQSDPVKPTLPPERGSLVYLSENTVRSWTKASATTGLPITITETKREPLIIAQDEEDGFRLEYSIKVGIPQSGKLDLVGLGQETFNIANAFAAVLDEGFVTEFKTSTKKASLAAE